MSDVPMGPRPDVAKTTKEAIEIPQAKRGKRQRTTGESEQTQSEEQGKQDESTEQTQQEEPSEQTQPEEPSEPTKVDEPSEPSEQTQPDEQEASEPSEQTKPEEPSEQAARPLTPGQLAAQEHKARMHHNERTGGGKLEEGEVQRQRDEHNERVGDASR